MERLEPPAAGRGEEGSPLKPPAGEGPCRHLDSVLVASGAVREHTAFVFKPPVYGNFCHGSSGKANTEGNLPSRKTIRTNRQSWAYMGKRRQRRGWLKDSWWQSLGDRDWIVMRGWQRP